MHNIAHPASTRQYFLDWLRIGAFALLVLYHVGRYYDGTWDWHVKSPTLVPALEQLMRLSNPWRMSLLFLLSGAATVWLWQHRPQGLLRERAVRLLLPLLTGVLVVVPPQPYFEVVQQLGYMGSYLEFLGLYFTAYGGFCRGGDCLVLPTWNHLWFLPYLFAYTALLVIGLRALPQSHRRSLADCIAALPAWALWWLPIAWLALLRLTLQSRFGTTHALVDDWYNHASYFSVFVAGVALAARPALFARLEALRWPALGMALLAWWGMGEYFEHVRDLPEVPEGLRALQRVAHAAMQWSAIVALLSFARRHLNHDHPWRAPLNEAVFPVYVLHQTIIIVLAMAALPLALHPAVEGPLLVAGTFALALAAWRLMRRAGPLRPWVGLPTNSQVEPGRRRPGVARPRIPPANPARPPVNSDRLPRG